MPYSKVGPFTDNVPSPPINAAFLNNLETAVATFGAYIAPAPTGVAATDQANIQPLILASQTTGYPVLLQPGTYVGNFYGNQAFEQPIIRGSGKHLTTVQAASSASPVLKFRGGSGAVSGGALENVTLIPASGGGGVGLDFSGSGGVQATRVRFNSGFTVCAQFHNELGNDFTEYCVLIDCEFNVSASGTAVTYQVDNGIESFHGSGLRGANVINVASGFTGTIININTTAFPYQAPLEFDVFPQAANAILIANNSGARQADFYGSIRIETGNATVVASGYPVWFAGSIHQLGGSGTVRLGSLELVDKVTYNSGVTAAHKLPKQWVTAVGNTTTVVTPRYGANGGGPVDNNACGLVWLTLSANNYFYVYQLLVYQSPFNSGGTVTQLGNPQSNNTAGYGAPTLTWANYGLTVTNTGFPSSGVTAYVEIVPFGGQTVLPT